MRELVRDNDAVRHVVGGADVATQLDAERAIAQATELGHDVTDPAAFTPAY